MHLDLDVYLDDVQYFGSLNAVKFGGYSPSGMQQKANGIRNTKTY